MKLNTNHQNLVSWALHAAGLLAVALILTTFYQLGYARLADQGEVYAGRVEQLEKLLSIKDTVRKNHQSLRQKLDNIEQEAATMRRHLPHEMQKDQFEDSIREVAAKAGFELEIATWNSPTHTPSHSLVEVTLDGVGSFASICQLLDEINQLARITKISRLQLESDPESDRYPCQVTFVLVYGIQSNDTDRKDGVL